MIDTGIANLNPACKVTSLACTSSPLQSRPLISVAPDLASPLCPETDIKVKNGVIGLLKHLAYVAPAHSALSEAGINAASSNNQILALIKHSNSTMIKSKGTHMFVNVIRTL